MNTFIPPFLSKFFTDEEIANLKKREILCAEQFKDFAFLRLSSEYKTFCRGTIFYEGGVIAGYPRIMRILHLENGINRYFKNKFYVEEKMDGYNVRVALINGTPLCFTRGGFICPFTTDRIQDLFDINFFNEYPEYTICGEVVGPGSPYNTEVIPYIEKDVAFFVFDIIDKNGNHLPAEKRYRILEQLNIQQVRKWGPFDSSNIDKIKEIIINLDKEGREGIVVKSVSSGKSVKYVTLSSCLRDLQATAHLITELPSGFFMQRILRAVFFCNELRIPFSSDYLMDSVKTLYLMPAQTLKKISEGESIKETFDIQVNNKKTIDDLLHHLNRSGIRTQLISVERTDRYYRARFHRIYIKGTKELRRRLTGHGFFD